MPMLYKKSPGMLFEEGLYKFSLNEMYDKLKVLITNNWLKTLDHKHLITNTWSQTLDHKQLITNTWSQKLDCKHLITNTLPTEI